MMSYSRCHHIEVRVNLTKVPIMGNVLLDFILFRNMNFSVFFLYTNQVSMVCLRRLGKVTSFVSSKYYRHFSRTLQLFWLRGNWDGEAVIQNNILLQMRDGQIPAHHQAFGYYTFSDHSLNQGECL